MIMKIERSSDWEEGFINKLKNLEKWDSWTLYKMNYDIVKMKLITDFTGLQATKYLPNLKPLTHQLEAAETVIERMNGKAILADEVGLGKTIEAGLILKEYLIRGLVKRALILAPASLINQWIEELNIKFHIPAIAYKKNVPIERYDVLIMSMDTAKKSPHKERIYEQDYDMIIIDEAHKLKNHKTQIYEFVQGLKKKFCLLLTATPIQNDVFELFYLISLLKPGHLGNYDTFQSAFSASKHDLEHNDYLKELVNQVMVRNRREDTGIEWTNRRVQIVPIRFTKEEEEVYNLLGTLQNTGSFSMITLQKEMCSSKEATALTLTKMLEDNAQSQQIEDILAKLMALEVNSKAKKTLEIVEQAKDKVIIFTEYRATQIYLQWYLHSNGITSVLFNGKYNKSKRDYMKHLFKERAQVLIATEAGGEGINLQFCHHVINYDLPWNPMKLEQRIGRVHRLGQEHDVHIYNLAIANTIEENILALLHTKIDVFEKVVGDLDAILSNFKESV
ncbi:ATP-dependent helicase [Lysinibacillus sphaericus]|uniref:DEAD/DEAH box helicase n=1 Tax=Lysinibacillus sphaericus TaxID=1421 RepID=UPI001D55DC0F|nr:SNF2-related protein [Lysinibacillus sphaericus]MBG9456821.1 ATP-dependent helicase [Lysinibacillus sphaericus]MBG9480576.1 ATP-dependent helicase [Lysinibacillus sphaericus]MBG9591323.1 ATP-dependent helicase [Lysinibacillus sphaericus]